MGESLKENEAAAFNYLCDVAEKKVEKTEDDLYVDQQQTFSETLAIVKGKIASGIPMLTAKEEWVEQMLIDAVDLFGYDFVFEGERNDTSVVL